MKNLETPGKTGRVGRYAVKISSLAKKLMYVLNCFELPLAIFTLSGSVVNKCFGSCIQSIRFWISSKESPSVVDHLDQ